MWMRCCLPLPAVFLSTRQALRKSSSEAFLHPPTSSEWPGITLVIFLIAALNASVALRNKLSRFAPRHVSIRRIRCPELLHLLPHYAALQCLDSMQLKNWQRLSLKGTGFPNRGENNRLQGEVSKIDFTDRGRTPGSTQKCQGTTLVLPQAPQNQRGLQPLREISFNPARRRKAASVATLAQAPHYAGGPRPHKKNRRQEDRPLPPSVLVQPYLLSACNLCC